MSVSTSDRVALATLPASAMGSLLQLAKATAMPVVAAVPEQLR